MIDRDSKSERGLFWQRVEALYVLDIATGRWESSQALDALFGIDAAYERSTQGWEALIHRDDRAMMDDYFRNEVVGERKDFNKEYRVVRYDDRTVRWVRAVGRLELDAQGQPWQMYGTIHDITEVKEAEAALRQSEERYRTAFLISPDGVTINRLADGLYLDVNNGFLRLTDRTRDEVIGKTWQELDIWQRREDGQGQVQALQRDGAYENREIAFVAKNGEVITTLMSAHVLTLDGVPCVLSVMRDITERKRLENQIRQLAFHDPLTKLPNRRLIIDRLSQSMAASRRSGRCGALMFLDLDNFKPLNDAHGHEAGDLLLLKVANRLRSRVREIDTVSRFGGDEFVVLLSEVAAGRAESTAQAGIVAEKIRRTLAEPYLLTIKHDGKADITVEHHCTASIGVVIFGPLEASQDDILNWADVAMYHAKDAGRNLVRFYEVTT